MDKRYLAYTNRGHNHFPFKSDFVQQVDAIIKTMKKADAIFKSRMNIWRIIGIRDCVPAKTLSLRP